MALVAVVETSIPRTWPMASAAPSGLDPLAPVDRPDVLVHDVLEPLLASGDRMWVDLARRHPGGQRLQRRLARQDRCADAGVPARVARLDHPGERALLEHVRGDQERAREGVDPADVGM